MTTPLMVQTWNEITDGHNGDEAANLALMRLHDAPWLANIGRPSSRDNDAMRVDGWPQALRMFTEGIADVHATGDGTSTTGTLNAPIWLLLRRLDLDNKLNRRTADAANHALERLMLTGYRGTISRAVRAASAAGALTADPFETKIAVGDYAHEFIRLLFIEIYAGDVAEPRCSYFRDQLGWFLAGFFPCGWEGEWPHGRMRVF